MHDTAKRLSLRLLAFVAAVALAGAAAPRANAAPTAKTETIKISLIKQAGGAPLFIAQAKGYFAAEGLDAQLIYSQSGQAIAVGVASGDIDFGAVGISGGLYNLAGQGALKIIAGAYRDAPGFPVFALIASNRAYAGGLTSYAKLPGRLVGTTAIGSAGHYELALLAEKVGVDLASVRVASMGSANNANSAIVGGQIDATLAPVNDALPFVEAGSVHLIGYPGDIVPWQLGVIFTATKNANERHDTIERFLSAYRKGARDFVSAFVGSDGKRRDGPAAPEILAIIAKAIDLPPDKAAHSLFYVDPEGRLDAGDITHQIAWFRSQGMVKGNFDPASVIDQRYAIPLPH